MEITSIENLSVEQSMSAQANNDDNYYLSVHSGGGRLTTSLSNGRLPLNAKCGNDHITHHGSPFHVTFKGKGKTFMSSPLATKRKVKSKGEDVRKTRKQGSKWQNLNPLRNGSIAFG
ncbi:hypothetical protein Avbf_15763 [Armadillidium vulgare]|nr:hypothetical protein Avbf_15763 [Armadillidium vulgare]